MYSDVLSSAFNANMKYLFKIQKKRKKKIEKAPELAPLSKTIFCYSSAIKSKRHNVEVNVN